MLIVTPIEDVCNCSMFCCTLLYVHSSFAIILMGKRELLLYFFLSSWCLVIVVWLFLSMPRVCLQIVIVVFPDNAHYFCMGFCFSPIRVQPFKLLTIDHDKFYEKQKNLYKTRVATPKQDGLTSTVV